jgi:hypothetical protein
MSKLDFKGLLTNQAVLYVVLFLSVFSLIGYLIVGNLDAVLFFILTGFITSFFSKNMIIVLLVALLGTNFLWSGVLKIRQEGLENMASDKKKDKKEDKSSLNNGQTQPQALQKTNMSMSKNMPIQDKNKLPMNMDNELFKGDDEDMKAKNKMTNGSGYKGGPKSSPTEIASDNLTPTIDRAATTEAAYDNIQKALGDEGIKKLTDDTMRLLDKQQKLQESLTNLTPLFQQAQQVLSNFDMSKINDMLGGFDMSQFNKVFDQFGLNPMRQEKKVSIQYNRSKNLLLINF